MSEVLYSFEADVYHDKVDLVTWNVVATTSCGKWVTRNKNFGCWNHNKRYWVKDAARKKRAYPTIAEALNGFIARKKRQVAILSSRLEEAKQLLAIARQIDPSKLCEAAHD